MSVAPARLGLRMVVGYFGRRNGFAGLQILKLLTITDITDNTAATGRPRRSVAPIQLFRFSIANMEPARRMAMAPGSGTETGSTKFQARA